MQALELKLPPVAVFLIAGAGMWLASHFLAAATFSIPGARLLATACAVAGITVGIAGIVAFRTHGTTVHPMHPHKASMLVKSGIYRFTRNPMYLGLALALAGWVFVLGNAASALFLPVFVGYMSRFQIIPEERALLALFGDDFADYMANVRRWL